MRSFIKILLFTALIFVPTGVCAQDSGAGNDPAVETSEPPSEVEADAAKAEISEPPSEAEADAAKADIKEEFKADKTGTNPINFQYDFRLYNEYQWLNTDGDGWQNTSTLEFRAPFANGKWQFRMRARGQVIQADLNGDGIDDLDDAGLGDTDIRFLTVPYMNLKRRIAIAPALEVFLDTATDDALGSGSWVLGPQAFVAFFRPFGLPFDFFPGYQHKFSVGGNDVHQGLIDLFVLKTWRTKTRWLLLDPQIVLDYENDAEFALIDVEVGAMLEEYIGLKGHSAYLRPSFGIGTDRPYDYSLELGYKIVW